MHPMCSRTMISGLASLAIIDRPKKSENAKRREEANSSQDSSIVRNFEAKTLGEMSLRILKELYMSKAE